MGNFAARAERRRALLELERLRVERQRLQDQILLQVRRAVRAIGSGAERVRAGEAAAELARQEYEAARIARREGDATGLDELQALERLETARLTLLQARVDYQLARMQLERATGELLPNRNVVAEEHLAPVARP